jgi:hypothetical protein
MGNSRLVNGPIVERRVGDWVSGGQLDKLLVGRLLLDRDIIRTNSHVETKGHVLSTSGVSQNWVNMDRDTTLLSQSGISSAVVMLFGEVNLGSANVNMDANRVALGTGGLEEDWVNENRGTILVLLDELLSSSGLLLNGDFIGTNLELEAHLLGFGTSRSHEDGVNIDWDTFLLSEFDSDGGGSIGDEILHLSSGNISIHQLENAIFVRLLSQFDGDWAWSVGDEVLQLSTRDISVHKLENGVFIGFLCKLNSNRGWPIGH